VLPTVPALPSTPVVDVEPGGEVVVPSPVGSLPSLPAVEPTATAPEPAEAPVALPEAPTPLPEAPTTLPAVAQPVSPAPTSGIRSLEAQTADLAVAFDEVAGHLATASVALPSSDEDAPAQPHSLMLPGASAGSASTASPGSGASGTTPATAGDAANQPSIVLLARGGDVDDDLPSVPVYDTDVSPD